MMLLVAAPRSALAACSVHGEHARLGAITVRAGAERLHLVANDVRATAHPERLRDEPVDVDVELHFRATPDAIPYATSAPIVARPIELGVGVELSDVRARGRDLVAALRYPGSAIEGVPIPCAAATLDTAEPSITRALDPLEELHGALDPIAYRTATAAPVAIFEAPGSGAFVRVGGDVELFRVLPTPVRAGQWMRVVASYPSVAIDGWVRIASLSRDRVPAGATGFGLGRTCGMMRSHHYRALKRGARVRSRPGGPVWATIATDHDLEIGAAEGAWIPIRSLAGLDEPEACGELKHAWVHASALADAPSN